MNKKALGFFKTLSGLGFFEDLTCRTVEAQIANERIEGAASTFSFVDVDRAGTFSVETRVEESGRSRRDAPCESSFTTFL